MHGSPPFRIHSIIFPTSFLFVFDGFTNGHLSVGHGPPTGPTTVPFRFPFVGESVRDSSGFDPALTRDGSGLSFRFSSHGTLPFKPVSFPALPRPHADED